MKYMRVLTFITLVGILSLVMTISASANQEQELPIELSAAPGTQALFIKGIEGNTIACIVTLYEKIDNEWTEIMTMPGVVGKKGIAAPDKKVEGDLKTPSGIFPAGISFGTKKPTGILTKWKNVGQHDYWVDDPASSEYNTWQIEKGDPKKRWKSAEKLAISSYQYAMVVEYNMYPVVKNKGSAIFIHIWKDEKTATSGCIAVSKENIVALMRRVDPFKKPVVIINHN